uniref:Uncharacterized protein n=1 Tax=Panagrolaimus sp. JU765 TaxID=591449 RepID=A0AC34QF49_9BILA
MAYQTSVEELQKKLTK